MWVLQLCILRLSFLQDGDFGSASHLQHAIGETFFPVRFAPGMA